VGIQRGTVVLGVAPLDAELLAQEGVAARSVHHEARAPMLDAAILVLCMNGSAAVVRRKSHIADPAALDDLRAQPDGIADQDFVELGSPHLVGERHGFVPGIPESEGLGLVGVPGRNKFRAPFLDANVPDGLTHAELLEQLQIGRQQRLADMKARMMSFFKDRHLVTLLRQQRPYRGARRATTNHQDVALACYRGGRAARQSLLGHAVSFDRHSPNLQRARGTVGAR
jgi:hypothetical protein